MSSLARRVAEIYERTYGQPGFEQPEAAMAVALKEALAANLDEKAVEAAARAAITQLGMNPDDSSGQGDELRWQTEAPTMRAAIAAYLNKIAETP